MNKIGFKIFIVFCLLMTVASCRSKRDVSDVKSGGDATIVQADKYNVNTILQANTDWTDVTINGSITISTSSNLNSAVQLKMIKDESISISIRPLLGIEMGKLYITNDSIVVLDKYHKLFFKGSIKGYVDEKINISSLQNLLLSRAFIPEAKAVNFDWKDCYQATRTDENGNWTLTPKEQDRQFAYNFDMEGNNLKNFNLEILNGRPDNVYSMAFSGYRLTDNGIVASQLKANIPIQDTTVKFQMLLNKLVRWNSGIQDYIRIPNDAQQITIADISKLLSNP